MVGQQGLGGEGRTACACCTDVMTNSCVGWVARQLSLPVLCGGKSRLLRRHCLELLLVSGAVLLHETTHCSWAEQHLHYALMDCGENTTTVACVMTHY